jgi:hypothetical protein
MTHNAKAQSAMEYLMTYGWEILIIAIVLEALFSFAGVFSGTSVIGTSCVASQGSLCNNLTFTHGTGDLAVTIGQNTGVNWANSIIIFATQGSPMLADGPLVNADDANTVIGQLASGQTTSVMWFGVQASPSIGTVLAGSIWACYTSSAGVLTYAPTTGTCAGTGTVYYTQLATLTAKAT